MKWILLSVILFSSLSIFAQTKDEVVATVNGKKIYKSILLRYHEQNLKFVRANKKVTIENSLNDLINRIIGIENAKKAKVDKRPDIIKKMNDIIYHAHISDEIAPLLQRIKVNDSDIKKYYSKNPEYRTSQILLRLRAVPSEDEVAEALEKSLKIYNELQKDPKKFEAYARQFGQTSTAQAGGDLGYQPRTRLSTEYFEAIKGKRKGSITKPFRSQYGIHIVKVTGEKTYKQIDNKLYKKIVYDIKRDKILEDYFAKQRKQAKIKIDSKKLKLQ